MLLVRRLLVSLKCTGVEEKKPLKSWPDWERRGTMVTPEWPPTTVMFSSSGSVFRNSETKRAARTTSSVVTPNNLESTQFTSDSQINK